MVVYLTSSVFELLQRYRGAVAAVQASYGPDNRRWEFDHDLPSLLVYRPLSLWVTPVFQAARCSATGATVIGILLSLAMPAVGLLGGLRGAAVIALLVVIVHTLDCVDGNLARTTGAPSEVGRLLDGASTLIVTASYFVAVGVLSTISGGGLGRHGIELGLAAAVLYLIQHDLVYRFDHAFSERVWGPYLPPPASGMDIARIAGLWEHAYVSIVLVIAAAWGKLDWFLMTMAGYQALAVVIWLPKYVAALRKRL